MTEPRDGFTTISDRGLREMRWNHNTAPSADHAKTISLLVLDAATGFPEWCSADQKGENDERRIS